MFFFCTPMVHFCLSVKNLKCYKGSYGTKLKMHGAWMMVQVWQWPGDTVSALKLRAPGFDPSQVTHWKCSLPLGDFERPSFCRSPSLGECEGFFGKWKFGCKNPSKILQKRKSIPCGDPCRVAKVLIYKGNKKIVTGIGLKYIEPCCRQEAADPSVIIGDAAVHQS